MLDGSLTQEFFSLFHTPFERGASELAIKCTCFRMHQPSLSVDNSQAHQAGVVAVPLMEREKRNPEDRVECLILLRLM